jgi:hypothetical protein
MASLKKNIVPNSPPLVNPQAGGAVLEYILVTAFAAVVGMAALGFVGKIIKERLSSMAQRLGIEDSAELSLPWDEPR